MADASKRQGAVTFKNNPMTLVGPVLKVGDAAPDFSCADGPMSAVTLKDTPAKARIFSVVPSLDTAVCGTQTKKFDDGLTAMGDKVASYTVSLDSPFAQKRFCTAEGIKTMVSLSDAHDQSFGKNYGVLMEGLSVPVLARSVFVVDPAGKISYIEVVKEVTHEPNYDAALAALKQVAG